jgi:ABC-type branched-subunit amino acid transport system substrate-binding protein
MQGAVLALEQLKAQGGLFADLQWVVEDTALKAPVAVQKAEKLIELNKVHVITGSISSSSALAVREVIDKHRVFFTPTVGANELTTLSEQCSRFLFRTELMTWQEVSALAALVQSLVQQGVLGKRYWLVVPEYAYGISMRETWRHKTRGFLTEAGYSGEQGFGLTDHAAILTEIAATRDAGKVDFITTCLLGSPLVTFMQQADAAGVIGTKPGQLPVVDPILQFNSREIGAIAVGHYTTMRYSLLHESPENRQFIQAFHSRWHDYPDNFAHNAYVAVQMLARAMEAAGTLAPETLIGVLEQERPFQAPMGESYFRCVDHQIVRDIGAGRIVQVKEYPFPVEAQIGERVPGKEALAGIEQKCKLGVCARTTL